MLEILMLDHRDFNNVKSELKYHSFSTSIQPYCTTFSHVNLVNSIPLE